MGPGAGGAEGAEEELDETPKATPMNTAMSAKTRVRRMFLGFDKEVVAWEGSVGMVCSRRSRQTRTQLSPASELR